MKAIILVGGLGTRLRAVVPDVPKPMAPIHGKPFLAHLLQYLKQQGFTSIIFSVHYMRQKIADYFQSYYLDMTIEYAEEETPLGTGGAILNALSLIKDEEPVFVLNGDTFVKLNYQAMFHQHHLNQSAMTMALRAIDDCSRYGKVLVEDNKITAFKEKGEAGSGLINAGIYLLQPSLFSSFDLTQAFSFESELLIPYLNQIKPDAFLTDDYFIDIGIPSDYARAQVELV